MNKSKNIDILEEHTTPLEGEIVKPSKVSIHPKRNIKSTRGTDIKYKKFAKAYQETGRARASAIMAGYSPTSAHTTASRLLKNEKVLAILNKNVEKAEGVLVTIMSDENERSADRMKAATEILDRTIGKPIQRTEQISVNITVETMLQNEAS